LNLQIEACNNDFLGECVCASLAGNTGTLNSHDGYKGSRNDAPLRNLESWIVLDEDTVHAPNRTKRACACIEFASRGRKEVNADFHMKMHFDDCCAEAQKALMS